MQNSAPYVCTYLESFITPKLRRNYADHFSDLLLDADSRIASEFSLNLARCTPLPKARCDPLSHTHSGLVSHTIGAPGKQLPGAAIAGLSHSARHRGAGQEFGSTIRYGAEWLLASTHTQPVCFTHHNWYWKPAQSIRYVLRADA